MMHCQNCGQVNTQAGNFCRFCGTKFSAMQQPGAANLGPNNYPGGNQNGVNYNGSNYNGLNYNGGNYNPVNNQVGNTYENSPPRPYSWKTDEYQLPDDKTPKTKTINRVQPLGNFQPAANAGMQTYQHSQAMSHNFNCPRCNSQLFPRISRQISTAGWIVFAALLITFFPLFWIGFLIKEEVRICPVCNFKYT